MLRLLICFLYMSGYLIYSIPALKRMKNLDKTMPVAKRDALIQEIPRKWSRTIMNLTGSTVTVNGSEHLPEGPVVFVSNHEGNFDVPTLLGFLDKPFGFISKVEVKKVPVLSTWMEVLNCVFLDRSDRRKAIQAIRDGVQLLKEGHSIAIFPEGTRSKGGPIGEFKTGSFRMAKDARVPIVPISIQGTSAVFEKNNRLVKPSHITVTILPPVAANIFDDKDMKDVAEYVKGLIVESLEETKKAS